jgi:hypothetical protein
MCVMGARGVGRTPKPVTSTLVCVFGLGGDIARLVNDYGCRALTRRYNTEHYVDMEKASTRMVTHRGRPHLMQEAEDHGEPSDVTSPSRRQRRGGAPCTRMPPLDSDDYGDDGEGCSFSVMTWLGGCD